MAAGLPVLAHDIPGVGELVRSGVEGLLLPLDQPDAYAQALRTLLASRPLRRQLGQAAQKRAADFGWPRVGGQVESFYRQLLDATRERSELRSAR
jgi:phosphatidylinositol alpha-mannosyltransferase